MEDQYGPRTAAVEAMLERAGALTEDEADCLWDAHLHEKDREGLFRAALEAIVDAAAKTNRRRILDLAERSGRDAVRVYPNTAKGRAICGYVGRLAEAITVGDLVDAISLEPLTRPWVEVIGPLESRESSSG